MKRPSDRPKPSAAAINRACKLVNKGEWTIRQWYNAGCDISSDEAVLKWSEERGHKLPSKSRIKKATQPLIEPETVEIKFVDRLPPPGDEGAAAALKRLQGLELVFYSRLQKALLKNQLEWIQQASKDYNVITESLRKYESAVEQSRRDLGHLIPKGEAQDGARAAAMWMRLAWRLWLSSALPDLFALKDLRTAKAKAEESMNEMMGVAFKNAADAKLKIPEWALPVIKEEFHVTT